MTSITLAEMHVETLAESIAQLRDVKARMPKGSAVYLMAERQLAPLLDEMSRRGLLVVE